MKTILLTLEYPPFKGGVANYYNHLVKYWPTEIKVFDKDQLLDKKVLIPWLAAFFKLKKYLKKNPGTQVLIGQVLPLGTVAWLNYLIKPYNYSVFLHGMDFNFALRKKRKSYLMNKSLTSAHKIICANSHVAELVSGWNSKLDSKIIIANPGINELEIVSSNLWRKKYKTGDRVVLLSLGRLVKRKGVDKVLEALTLLDQEFRDRLTYVIAGQGEEENHLKDLAANLKIPVIFTGEVSEEEKWALLDLCDIFIMPAREIAGDFEGFGIVYLEANLYGKPVIAGRSGGISDAVKENESGLLVDPENVKEISESIRLLVNDKKERERLGFLGRARASQDFKWKDQINNLSKKL